MSEKYESGHGRQGHPKNRSTTKIKEKGQVSGAKGSRKRIYKGPNDASWRK